MNDTRNLYHPAYGECPNYRRSRYHSGRLCQSFKGLAITKLAVYEYITKECCFSLKRR
ncbi:hypothetical protein RO3G_12577 [Rhizopus delemar RA 99-880]|uniref:Uncharacterized protein n=1 Tax=Rhizopus delemar (strain RA 99-880 / ATCC MYA-4621 / FGSC 9543 / NRRL 43880) TaxID=246409 RepID=I1CHD6_RHIO9|nr:hypothetical protein RO3G_12577 [Rhizopus delemar RA 99-880]|eukprot:EIE87866.1 hypothetical protein RO3G_12577 [Rhizopus delemar RA 99-880]